jgi:hypothetical protein
VRRVEIGAFSMPGRESDNAHLQTLTEEQNKRASALLRPLSLKSDNTHYFERDKDLLRRLQKWLNGGIMLAGNRTKLDVNPRCVYQLPNIRPDCNGYVARITDAQLLARIISEGNKTTERASKILAKVSKNDILYGSLYWLRQTKRNKDQSENKNHPDLGAADIVEEIYWLDVVYRVGELALPLIRIHYNSIGVAISRRETFTAAEVDVLLSRTPYYVESNTVLLGWHELAERLGIQGNLYYLRACFTAAEFHKDVIAKKPGPATGRRAVVYLRPGPHPSGLGRSDYHAHFGPESTSPAFNRNRPYEKQHTPFKTMTLKDLRSCDLTGISYHNLEEFTRKHESSLPRIVAPKPAFFPDTGAARQFIFFVTNQFPGIRYEGDGYFSVIFDATDPSAMGGVRGSGWVVATVAIAIAPATAGPVAVVVGVGGVSAAAGIALGTAITGMRQSDPERLALRKRLLDTASACSVTSQTEAECRQCVEFTGALDQEKDNLFWDSVIENTTSMLVSGAGGCGTGALIGLAAGAIGGPIAVLTAAKGCAIGAIVGLGIAGGAAVLDILAHQEAVNTLTSDAFGPCETVEMQF